MYVEVLVLNLKRSLAFKTYLAVKPALDHAIIS